MLLSSRLPRTVLFLGLSGSFAYACEDGYAHEARDGRVAHSHARRLQPPALLTPPSRPLEWGDVNILHTTDTHGWLLGHQKSSFPEPNYSGDFGEFASFVSHMKKIAEEKDVDLLLVDSGDLHDGTGLVDGYPSGGVDGHDALEIFKKLPYDVLAIGNHELYVYNNTWDMHRNFALTFKGRYLSSNANITYVDNGQVINTPVGSRFAKFKTRKGRRVTAFGVLFDFKGNDKNTTVQVVGDMVKESWFLSAIQEEPDFFLLVGHMPIARDKWPLVVNAIRGVHPNTPILIFGGHSHIRDCAVLDGRTIALQSGRYMETLGWMSVNLERSYSNKNLMFSRRYLDPNRVTYEYHTNQLDTFDTHGGKVITEGLQALAKKFNLDFLFGTAPHDFTITRAPYPSNYSLLRLFIDDAVPVAIQINNTRSNPFVVIVNSGSQRFDILAGTFTKNDQLIASPFKDAFLFIPDVPFKYAKQVLPMLNGASASQRREPLDERERELYAVGEVDMLYRKWLEEMNARRDEEMFRRVTDDASNLTLGYVTKDSCPGIGDDTLHIPLPYYPVPDYIGSTLPDVADETLVDLVFFDFIATDVIKSLNTMQTATTFTTAQVQMYSPFYANEVLGVYAQAKWN